MIGDIATKKNILNQAKKLRVSTTWKKVYISPDLMPKERQQSKKLRDELKRRKDAGEKDLYIKFGKIVSHPPASTSQNSN